MADSEALRSRRKRRHAQGDHGICRHPLESVPSVAVLPGDGEIDPVAELKRSALRLVRACEADPSNAVLARELRATLAVIPAGESGSPLDSIRRRAMVKTYGWASDDPDLLSLAQAMFMDDPMPFLRSMAEEVP